MPGLVSPAGASPGAGIPAPRLRALKDTVRSALGLDAGAIVLIQQLECRETGCAPVETVVADLGPPQRIWKFAVPAADLSEAALRAAITDKPGGSTHDQGN